MPRGLRQNQRVSTRIVLESKDNVLKVPRGPFIDAGAARVTYVVQGDIATRTPIEIGGTSISEIEITRGLNEGDQIIISSLADFDQAATVHLAD